MLGDYPVEFLMWMLMLPVILDAVIGLVKVRRAARVIPAPARVPDRS